MIIMESMFMYLGYGYMLKYIYIWIIKENFNKFEDIKIFVCWMILL